MSASDTQATPAQPPQQSPFDLVGGAAVVRQIVNRFYDLMESDPALAPLRAMHAPDLAPMRDSLAGFLIGWMGGPRDWFTERPGRCVMSVHAGLAIDQSLSAQWLSGMTRAVSEAKLDPHLAEALCAAFAQMARGMTRTPAG